MIIDRNVEKVLIKEGVLTQEQLDAALAEHRKTKENLTTILVRFGYASEEGIIKAISKHYEIPYEEITPEYVEADVIRDDQTGACPEVPDDSDQPHRQPDDRCNVRSRST